MSLEAENHEGMQPLLLAAFKARASTASRLLALRAEPDAADVRGNTASHLAAAAGSAPLLEALLAAGAHGSARNYRGEPPLARASAAGHSVRRQECISPVPPLYPPVPPLRPLGASAALTRIGSTELLSSIHSFGDAAALSCACTSPASPASDSRKGARSPYFADRLMTAGTLSAGYFPEPSLNLP